MAGKFADPGGDSTFTLVNSISGGFWSGTPGPTVVADIVHGAHVKSLKPAINNISIATTPTGVCADAGGRISFYLYLNALGASALAVFAVVQTGGSTIVFQIKITSGGVVQLFEATNQLGSNGATLSTGTWNRISVAWTITNTTTNQFRVFVNGTSSISVSNATITNTSSDRFWFGHGAKLATFDSRWSDFYADDSSALTDIASDVWVTAKRPFSNGTNNAFTTQIGSGGSGYGSGHAPQVNERPISSTNGWLGGSIGGTEEYNIESASSGDINISGLTIINVMGWAWISQVSGTSPGSALIVNGSNVTTFTGTTSLTMIEGFTGATVYPAGSGTDIGVTNAGSTSMNLMECGIMVIYNPTATTFLPRLPLLGVG